MLGITHALAGIIIGSLFSPWYITIPVGFFFALLCDVDEKKSLLGRYLPYGWFFKHRGFFHSSLFVLLSTVTVFLLTNATIALIAFLAMLSHIFLDSITKQGIKFSPLPRIRGPFVTGGIAEIGIRGLLFIGIIFIFAIRFFSF